MRGKIIRSKLQNHKIGTLGHADISTTLNIYADVTKDLKKSEFEGLDDWFNKPMNQKDTGNDPSEE